MKHRRIWAAISLSLTVLWIIFIFQRSMKSASVSTKESSLILELLNIQITNITSLIVRKGAHIFEFFILGVLLWTDFLLLRKEALLLPIGIGTIIAAADEGIQTIVFGRAGRITDILIDMCGVCAACLILRLVLRLCHGKKKRKARDP